MDNKMENSEEMKGSASLKSRKGRRDEKLENVEQTVCKKPRVTISDDHTDNADDGQDETAKEPEMPCDDKTEGLTGNVLQKQDETQNVDEVKPDNTEENQNAGERDTDNREERQIRQNQEDDAEGRREKASSVQTGEEEGNERGKRVENETSNRETNNDINTSNGINCAASNKEGEESRRDEEALGDESKTEDSTPSNITPENTNKSEELKEVKVDNVAANSGDKFKDSSEQPLDEETETEDQKQKGDENKMFPVGTGVSQTHHHGHYVHYGYHGHHGPHGLYNQGATCYLNSLLQVLFVTTEIHDRLNKNSDMDRELRNIFERLKKTTSETKNITRVLEIKDVFTQRDAPECLELILHKMSPEASEIFRGKLAHTTKCSEGHSISEEINPFWTLPLSLEDTDVTTCSLERSFESFFQKRVFTGDNQVYCNECNIKTDATSECEMEKSPQILTLLLKRFNFDFNNMSYVKSHCCVEVPCELKTKKKKYKLYGMVNHFGGLYGGHYTATVLSNQDQTWYECNDSRVHKIQGQLFAETGTYRSNTVYLLMYRATECQRPSETNQDGDEELPGGGPTQEGQLSAVLVGWLPLLFVVLLLVVVLVIKICMFYHVEGGLVSFGTASIQSGL